LTIVCVCNELTVSAREGKGYTVSGPRNLLFRIYSAKAPKEITVKGKKIKKAKSERLEENLENDTEIVAWSWNKETGVCSVRIPDKGIDEQFKINRELLAS
jgi:alpha-glucosidase